MEQTTFMGMLIMSLSVLVTIVFTILNFFSNRQSKVKSKEDFTSQSIAELNVNLKLLNASLTQLNKDMAEKSKKQEELEHKLCTHDLWLHNDDLRIDNHEKRLQKLDHEIGVKQDKRNQQYGT